MDAFEAQMGPDHPFTQLAYFHVGRVHNARGRWSEAETLLEPALRPAWEDTSFRSASQRVQLGVAWTGLGRFAEAESVLLDSHEVIHAHDGEERRIYEAQVLRALVDLYRKWEPPRRDRALGGRTRRAADPRRPPTDAPNRHPRRRGDRHLLKANSSRGQAPPQSKFFYEARAVASGEFPALVRRSGALYRNSPDEAGR